MRYWTEQYDPARGTTRFEVEEVTGGDRSHYVMQEFPDTMIRTFKTQVEARQYVQRRMNELMDDKLAAYKVWAAACREYEQRQRVDVDMYDGGPR